MKEPTSVQPDIPWRNLLQLGLGPAAQKNSYLRQLAKQAKREFAAKSIAGGGADGASLRAPRVSTAMSSRSGCGGAALGTGEDQDETSAIKGAAVGGMSPGTPQTTTAWSPPARGRSFECSTQA